MTEAEWLSCADLPRMLDFLRGELITLVDAASSERQDQVRRHVLRIVNPRKARLLACACCRLIWRLLKDDRSRNAVEITE
jgi:hypothetical protein